MPRRNPPAAQPLYNVTAVTAVESAVQRAIADFLSGTGGGPPRAVVAPAPAGAGKSALVVRAAHAARARHLRVAVATPTNDQAFGLVRRLAEASPTQQVTFVPASDVHLPGEVQAMPNVQAASAQAANAADLVVGTVAKLGDAFARGSLGSVDALLLDEAYQADASRYFALADIAPCHLLVGDSGQLSPFSTIPDADHWRGLPEDPLQTAVGVLRRNHPHTPVHSLPITRRLSPAGAAMAQLFYPGMSVEAAVLPDTRELRLLPSTGRSRSTAMADAVLDRAARGGWAHLELPPAAVLTADPETAACLVSLLRRLFERGPQVRCERHRTPQALTPARVAVGVSHTAQRDLVAAGLAAAGLSGVKVDTANKLQGLEFDVVLVWHPLAGIPEVDPFHLDPGRLCVLLTRHRHACVVVGRGADRTLLDAVPPPTPAYLGDTSDPVLVGWEAHAAVFSRLEAYRVTA